MVASTKLQIVTTSPISEELDIEKFQQFITDLNLKYKGITSKIWYNDDIYSVTEILDFDRMTEEEISTIGFSIQELKKQSRDEIIDSITALNAKSSSCR